jgi:hypothetical protein
MEAMTRIVDSSNSASRNNTCLACYKNQMNLNNIYGVVSLLMDVNCSIIDSTSSTISKSGAIVPSILAREST